MRLTGTISLCAFAVAGMLAPDAHAAQSAVRAQSELARRISPHARAKPDLTGRPRVGVASFYARMFFGRPMANGVPMDPRSDNAASRTLPLGTIAKVTNLETGKSAVVTIQDRGPYVHGRIVDLSPTTAHKIGITRRKGISKVVVAPLAVPLPDGTVKRGIAARIPRQRQRSRPVRVAQAALAAADRR